MQAIVRERVPAITAVLSVVSLALVFAAAGQRIPTGILPEFPGLLVAIPHLNVGISLAAITTISLGWRAIRRGDVDRHRLFMLASFALFAAFLVLYLYRVALLGPGEFPGPEALRLYVYIPILVIHIVLAVACVPLVYYALLLAATRPTSALPETNHARVGKAAATLWLISFSLGIVVYLMLYWLF